MIWNGVWAAAGAENTENRKDRHTAGTGGQRFLCSSETADLFLFSFTTNENYIKTLYIEIIHDGL